MKNRTILLVINNQTPDQYIKQVAQDCREQENHLSCFLMSAGVSTPPMIYGAPLYGTIDISDSWTQLLDEAVQTQKARVEEIEAVLLQTGGSADVQSLLCSPADTSEHISRRARVCDLALLAPNLRETPQFFNEAAHGILFKSPVGLMVNGSPTSRVSRALIAWDSSHAAAAAVHNALPYLKETEAVNIACFDPITTQDKGGADPGTDLAAWLSHHGCNVEVSQLPSGGKEIGMCIQDRAKEIGADLVVLGAYGHSRLVQAVLGGTTRTMLEQTEIPLLMAH